MIGKPYAGELHVRFDEGGQDGLLRKLLNGHEAGNGGYSQGSAYSKLSLSSTLPFPTAGSPIRRFWSSVRPTATIHKPAHQITTAIEFGHGL